MVDKQQANKCVAAKKKVAAFPHNIHSCRHMHLHASANSIDLFPSVIAILLPSAELIRFHIFG